MIAFVNVKMPLKAENYIGGCVMKKIKLYVT